MVAVTKGSGPGMHYDVFEVSLGTDLAAADRIAMWQDHVGRNQGVAQTRIERPRDFSGRTWTQRASAARDADLDPDKLQLVEFASHAIDYERSAKMARDSDDRSARLVLPIVGQIHLCQLDHAVNVGRGRLGVVRWDEDTIVSHGDELRAYILNIPPYALPQSRGPRGPLGIQPKNFILANVRTMIDNLAKNRATVTPAEFVEFSRAIVDLVAGTLDDRRAPELDAQARLVAAARRRIQLYSSDPGLTVGTLAEHLGVSIRHLQNAMKAVTRHTLGEELRATRLQHAYQMLTDPDSTQDIVDVATACGYSSLSGFRDAFVTRFDIQPGELRVRVRASERPVRVRRR